MRRRYRDEQRNVRFEVLDGRLVRTVALPDGRSYVHRCTREVFEAVAHAVEQRAADGVTLDPLAQALDAPATQVNVALEFLKERGCLVTRCRRNYPASGVLFEDAMTEFCYLRDLPY